MKSKRTLLYIIIILGTMLIVGCTVIPNEHIEDTKTNEIEKDTKIPFEEDREEKKEVDRDKVDINKADKIKLHIDKMTLEEKIGQLVILGIDGYNINENIEKLIKDYKVGGFILYSRNIKDPDQVLSLTNSLKKINEINNIPLFISVDEEGGRVSRVPEDINKLPRARDIGKKDDLSLGLEIGSLLGQTVKSLGYNMNFAPVLDIDSNPLNPVIGNRSFGRTIEIVSKLGIATMNGIKKEGVIPVIKHFPGHGDTDVDSHIGLPLINHSLDRLNNFELIPFKNAIDQGADVVMVAHILITNIDSENPATMSKLIIKNLLREELGFKGVVITDDMTMGAIEENYNIGDAAVKSLKAGTDIILVGHDFNKQMEVLETIKHEINKGLISIDRINESVYRVLKLKEKFQLEDNIIQGIDIKKLNLDINKAISKVNN